MKENGARPSRKKIAEYWADKYISKNLEIIDYYEEGAIPVIIDRGEPECWACRFFDDKIYDNEKYDKLIKKDNFMSIWNLRENHYLQRAHIKSKMLGGENIPSNYFLLCKECHEESPDYDDIRYFYAYIRHVRENRNKVLKRRNEELMRTIYELAYQMNKNILTFDPEKYDYLPYVEKMGLHNTSFKPYTIASGFVEEMDDLNIEQLSDKEITQMKEEFSKYGITFNKD
ncbi:MAG: hypothetical protein ACLRT4_03695 [Thomasclavelia sp.]